MKLNEPAIQIFKAELIEIELTMVIHGKRMYIF